MAGVNWVMDHWWLFDALPYLAFNVLLLRYAERDLQEPFGPGWRAAIAFAGIWLLLGVVAWTAAEELFNHLERFGHRTWRNHRSLLGPGSKRIAWAAMRLIVATAGLLALYVLSLATTGYHPTRFERIAALALILIGGAFVAVWRTKEKDLDR